MGNPICGRRVRVRSKRKALSEMRVWHVLAVALLLTTESVVAKKKKSKSKKPKYDLNNPNAKHTEVAIKVTHPMTKSSRSFVLT